ncbi:Xylulose kinase [Caloramator mitchellensis]|uniref:Xylulose kinase n=1 Tax=Caloramator mitchellensis TaxID=908809 RepID=A0A0R3JTP1_CALMK|nr:gluconokinase [Caloramator mitchellensis]KRQ86378.1 Xylulose kinase [Caloramator mitchellensis]
MGNYYIGLDIGTTSTKGILFSEKGDAIKKHFKEYPIISNEKDFKEQDPDEIFNAAIIVLKELINGNEEEIKFISFSSMMHSIMAIDKDGNCLTNCIIWADNRSNEYVKRYKENGIGIKYYKKTGTPIHPMSPLYKIMWLKDKQKDIFDRAYKFISIKEYVFYKLFNEFIVDYSIASATGMFNIFDLRWDEEILDDLGLNQSMLSKPVPTTSYVSELKEEYSNILGLKKKIPFIVGASDGCLANLGSGAIFNNTAAVTIGTSGAIRVAFEKPYVDEKARVFSYILTEDKYIVGGAINNGGIVYRWFRDAFAAEEKSLADKLNIDSYELLNDYVKSTPPGSNGILFLPFLSGERAPYWNSELKGAFLGIKNTNDKKDFTRAILEGICFDLRDVFEVIKGFGEINRVYANGGFVRSRDWVQMLSDVMNVEIEVSENYDSSITGAFLLGLLAINKIKNIEESIDYIKLDEKFVPINLNKKIYDDLFVIYRDAINRLMPVLEKL